jgi:hypothetical protein
MSTNRTIASVVFGSLLSIASIGAAQAASDVFVGGFVDQGLSALHNELAPSGGTVRSYGLSVTTEPDPTVIGFTPRFAGVPVGLLEDPTIDRGSLLKARLSAPGGTVERSVALNRSQDLGPVAIDVAAVAGYTGQPENELAESSSFGFGGGLSIIGLEGLRFDASYGRQNDVLGFARDRMTAGVGYGIGALDTRVSISSVAQYDNGVETDEKQIWSFGGQLKLGERWVVGGDLAYSSGLAGDTSTSGVVNFRFNF